MDRLQPIARIPGGPWLRRLAQGLTVAVGSTTLLGALPGDSWWLRMWDFPRLQILGCAALALVLSGLFLRGAWRKTALVVGIVCSLYQLWWVVPYSPLLEPEVQAARGSQGQKLKLYTANVLQSNDSARRLLAGIEQAEPDVVLLLETDEAWMQRVEPLNESYPYHLTHPLSNTYGIAFWSRYPLEEARIDFVLQPDIPSVSAVVALPSGRRVQIYGLHPRPPGPTQAEDTTERDAELVIVGRQVEESDLPTVVLGDLNDVAWSRTTRLFKTISGTLDPRVGRGLYNSFPAQVPLLRFPLDHVFHTDHFRLVSLSTLAPVGSDHLPLLVELSLEADADEAQVEPRPEPEETREAREIVAEAAREQSTEEQE